MNLRREQMNPVFIESCIGCDRISTGSEIRWAMEFSFQSGFELDCTSDESSNVETVDVGVLGEKLAWAAFRNDPLNPKVD